MLVRFWGENARVDKGWCGGDCSCLHWAYCEWNHSWSPCPLYFTNGVGCLHLHQFEWVGWHTSVLQNSSWQQVGSTTNANLYKGMKFNGAWDPLQAKIIIFNSDKVSLRPSPTNWMKKSKDYSKVKGLANFLGQGFCLLVSLKMVLESIP